MKRLGKELRGLSLYPYQDGGGCFVFSDTENSRFAMIERLPPHRYIGSFRIITGKYDRVTHSLDTALTPISLGKKYPTGLFVCQDELNEDGERQTYKLIHWDEIVHCFPDSLKIDLLVDPRKIGPHHKLP
ncbi:MAG: phytase [Lentisphaerae bacterium]|nr:MAG: phytase [Lentisphaerota bacterium]